MCTKSAEMYGSAIPDRRGSVGYRGFRADLCALIEPFYPKPGNGRPPVGVERMLRIYLLQHWFNLSDPAVEEALYDSQAMVCHKRTDGRAMARSW